jgi:hypothetical protein
MKDDEAPRRPGRPPVDVRDTSVHVCVTLPSRQFDVYCEKARQQGVSVPEVIRQQLGK